MRSSIGLAARPCAAPARHGVKPSAAGTKAAGKRFMFVINSDAAGGVEHLADTLGRDLLALGADVETEFLYPSGAVPGFKKVASLWGAARRIAAARPDVLITFQPTASVAASGIGRVIGCQACIVHESNLPGLSHPVPRTLDLLMGSLGFYSVTIMNTDATEQSFRKYPKSYRDRFRRIPHGVAWQPAETGREAVRQELGVPRDAPMLLTCARLSEQKSLQTVLAAMPGLPEAYFVVAGEGDYEAELRRVADVHGVASRTHFLGRTERARLFDLHAAADVFVFPSRSETFGIAAVEAAMSGLPVVASDIPATREVLTLDEPSPVTFVEDWSVPEWQAALGAAIGNRELGKHAAAFAATLREHYAIEEMLDRYRRLYDEVLL